LPLRWPTPPGIPDSPKRRYRSHYVYLGSDDLDDPANWAHLSALDLVLRLVDLEPLRPLLAWLLGWTSARGQVPFDPVSLFLVVAWQWVNNWSRAQALRNLRHPRYADYAQRFGFHNGDWPTEGGVRYFLTTLGRRSDIHAETVSVEVREEEGGGGTHRRGRRAVPQLPARRCSNLAPRGASHPGLRLASGPALSRQYDPRCRFADALCLCAGGLLPADLGANPTLLPGQGQRQAGV
jgi:hypothetical protein